VARIVRPRNPDEAGASIVLAFAADPFLRWLLQAPAVFLRLFPQVTRMHGQATAAAGTAWAREDGRGAAFWYPPGASPPAQARALLAEVDVVERASAVFAEVAAHVPPQPCWYLRQIGIDPRLQGQGHGGALIEAGLEEVDARREVAYLEATSDASRRFYERHGFEVVGTAQALGSPPLWVMVRPARSA
jgi:ribosomal protein S18 acetylase RimI-like enzyme